MFALTCILALLGIAVVVWWVPAEPARHAHEVLGWREALAAVFARAGLLRLYLGVFVLHAVQLSMWVAIPAMLVGARLEKQSHWQVYLGAVLLSFFAMGRCCFRWKSAATCEPCFWAAWPCCWGWSWYLHRRWVRHRPCSRWAPCCLRFSVPSMCWRPASQPGLPPGTTPGARDGAGVYNSLQSLGFLPGAPWAAGWSRAMVRRRCS